MVTDSQNLSKSIDDLCGADDNVSSACRSLADVILAKNEKVYISLALAHQYLDGKYSDETVLDALWALTAYPINLLKVYYEFIDDDCLEPLTPKQVSEAVENKGLPHPQTGEMLEDFEDYVYLSFKSEHEL